MNRDSAAGEFELGSRRVCKQSALAHRQIMSELVSMLWASDKIVIELTQHDGICDTNILWVDWAPC
jgi:hypothetical protein